MSDKSLDARLIQNIARGLLKVDQEGSTNDSTVRLEEAPDFPWHLYEQRAARGIPSFELKAPRLARSVWSELMRGIGAIEVSRLSGKYAALAHRRCQSEVEELLFLSLLTSAHLRGHLHVSLPWAYGLDDPSNCCAESARRKTPVTLAICPQHHVGQVHVDFMVTLAEATPTGRRPDGSWDTVWKEERLLIECDGHEFHERTKEQARRDKKRDRELQKFGFQVFRYTGSEVWADPIAVSEEIVTTLWRRIAGEEAGTP
jgi:hypothetical protein